MRSPIKYFGGKGGGLGRQIYKYFPDKSKYSIYLEPFAGAANLLFIKEPFGAEIYNDLEKNVYSLFKVLADKKLFKEFRRLCEVSFYSKEIRYEFREDLKKEIPIVERAYKFFYINRTSVNGMGGFSETATWIRRNMSKSTSDFLSSVEGLPQVHDRLSRVIIEKMDGLELINKYDRKGVFIYADPPYHHSTRTGARYTVDMDNEKQKEFIDLLLSLKNAMFLVSGYDCEEYNRLTVAGWEKLSINVNTIDGNRVAKTKTEFLWKNYKSNPAKEELFSGSKSNTEETNNICDDEDCKKEKNKSKESLFEGFVVKEKKRGRPNKFNIPSKLKCIVCEKYKKTNHIVFNKCLDKAKVSKELFISTYVCRSCRTKNNL
jgi:DNA adenine methylase